jgi:hypothetical protein
VPPIPTGAEGERFVSKSLPRCRVEHFLRPVRGSFRRRSARATLDTASVGRVAVGAAGTLALGAGRAATTGVLAARRVGETCAVVAVVVTRAEVAAMGNAVALASAMIERFKPLPSLPAGKIAKAGPVPGQIQADT